MSVTGKSGHAHQASLGQALVEFVLVFPVFFFILTGIIDAGGLFYSWNTLSNSTREGAHAAVTQLDSPLSIPILVPSAVQANATGLSWADVTVDAPVCLAVSPHPACDFIANGNPDPQSGDSVSVTVHYQYHSILARFLGATVDMSSTVQMVLE